jgi:hypothetical protein
VLAEHRAQFYEVSVLLLGEVYAELGEFYVYDLFGVFLGVCEWFALAQLDVEVHVVQYGEVLGAGFVLVDQLH